MACHKRIYKVIPAVFYLFFLSVGFASALEDGFGIASKTEGRYFIVWRDPEVNTDALLQRLNTGLSEKLLTGKTVKTQPSSDEQLIQMLDALFLKVCELLGMPPGGFKGNIKICRSRQQMDSIYNELFGEGLVPSAHSFYAAGFVTIYISADNFTVPVLGHEMSHCIIHSYFPSPPPAPMQEILAKYVEYQLRMLAEAKPPR